MAEPKLTQASGTLRKSAEKGPKERGLIGPQKSGSEVRLLAMQVICSLEAMTGLRHHSEDSDGAHDGAGKTGSLSKDAGT